MASFDTMSVINHYSVFCIYLLFITDQLNTTVHGTMKKSPYELVFGQPPHQNTFPGATVATESSVLMEDIEDILEDDHNDSQRNHHGEDSKQTDDNESPSESENDTEKEATKHFLVRQEADKEYRRNAERMQLKYHRSNRKNVQTFSVGDIVSIRIPRIDRSSTDSRRLPCIVVERLGSKFFLYR